MALLKEPDIRKIYAPDEKQLDVIEHVYTRFERMKDARAEEEKKWEKWDKQWNAYRPPKDEDDWKSDIYIPITTSVVEAQLAELVEQDLMPMAVERGAEDAGKAQVMNAILEYTWDQAKSDVALFHIIKDALIRGTGIGQEYYWKQPRIIKSADGTEKEVLEYDSCYLEPVKLEDFYIDERARGFSGPYGAQDAIRRYVMDWDDFKLFFKGKEWDQFNAAQYVKPGGDTNYYEFYKPPERIEHDREVEVLWYWNKQLDKLAIVANDVLVVDKPNPYKHKQLPFVRVIDVLRPYQFYGKGEPELMESLQDETNTLRRMTIDRNHLDIDKPILVSDTLTIDDEDIMSRPHGTIPVGDINGAKPLEYGDIPRSVFDQLGLLNDDKVRVTGMDERQQSVSTAGTATEAAILKEATLKRLNLKLLQIKKDTLVDLGRLRVANILQFYSQPKLEEILGEDAIKKAEADGTLVKEDGTNFKQTYKRIRVKDQQFEMKNGRPAFSPGKGYTFFEAKPEFFLPTHGGYDIRYKATSSIPVSKPIQMQKADEMYDRLISNPAIDPGKLAQYLIKSREENPDDFVKGQSVGQPQGVNLQKAIDLAGVENQEMLAGKKINPTPYAPVPHTEVHIQFMDSDEFRKMANEEVVKQFTMHVAGELMAQKQRGQAGAGQQGGQLQPGMPGQQPPQPMGGEVAMGDVVPGRMEGAGDVSGTPGGTPSGF